MEFLRGQGDRKTETFERRRSRSMESVCRKEKNSIRPASQSQLGQFALEIPSNQLWTKFTRNHSGDVAMKISRFFSRNVCPRILFYFLRTTDRTKSTPSKLFFLLPFLPDVLASVCQSVTWRELFTSFVSFDETRFDSLQGENFLAVENGIFVFSPISRASPWYDRFQSNLRISHG